ncbi:ABC transporter ATP-binding protein/permease [Lachnospiraceae bacterium CLA-AA-H246]|uniref:ABC transporter ATP-binding protein/permease n=2 Tax=Hominisplanchenecus faecis TaxID=2885351 RepID=A0ABS8EYG4_9FIRM|nr:ABC transporter ATP-binding protein [Hominisplanchenecus faecis]MCC2150112.1 ABC transporter ATP-binding protein/permease [Hominisplanchenecus faecis]
MAKVNKDVVKRLMSYIGHYKLRFAAVLICIVVNALAMVFCSLYLQTLIDSYITPLLQAATPDFAPLFRSILIMGCIYAVGILACLFYNRTMVSIAQGTLKRIRDEMFEHMQTLPIRYFDTHTHGDIMSHYTNDTDTLRQMLAQSIPQMFSSLITIISVFFAMLFTSWQLTIFVLCFVFIMLQVTGRVAGKSGYYFIRQQKALGDVNGYIEEMINGQKVIKVFCHEEKAKEVFDQKNEELCRDASAANSFANILMPIMGNLGNLQYVLLATIGGTMALGGVGGMTIGTIASFLQLSRSFMNPISQISNQLNMVVMALAGAERIFKLMDEEPEVDEGYVTLVNAKYDENGELTESKERTGLWAWKHPHGDGTLTYTKMRGEVRFYDVDFGYNEEKIVLHNISLYAEPGQKVAFVGSTGAGKTTITNLINRFYDLADGKIRYDDININKIKKADLRRSLGVVLQETNLFTGTIMENIRYGKLDATDEEVYAAAKLANADDFIRLLPNGYDTVITGNGGSLSQGQRQLIAIARAAVADPPVMILDEATSSIDTRTEAIVQRGMDALMKGRTVFVIAHRLSTVRNSDVIMVLEQGRIIERGSHDKLIAEKGKYYQLYTGAFELE